MNNPKKIYTVTGKYYDNSAEAGISDAAKDADTAKWLWSVSETLTGLKLVV